MVAQAVLPALISPREYLRREAQAERRHEYIAGIVCEMAGASRNQVELQSALATLAGAELRGKRCRILGQDTKLWIAAKEAYYYPDATIACPPNFIDDANGVIDNPTVIIEVLSPSTRHLDRGTKFADYRTLSSLREYVLIDSEARRVEVFSLENDDWMIRTYEEGVATLPSFGIDLDLQELYQHVVLPPDGTAK